MSVTSSRRTAITFSGDVIADVIGSAADNAASPGQVDIVNLTTGTNTITAPTGGTTPKACMILLPSGNSTLITLKGVAGDTGIPLHKTDPTIVAIDTTAASFVLSAAAPITGVRLVWS